MKTTVFIISLLFSALLGLAQPNDEPEELLTAEQLLAAAPQDLPVYDTSACKYCILVQLAYGTSDFLNIEVVNQFESKAIERVEMVYTSFARTKNFDQASLNRQRVEALKASAAKLFEPEVKWQLLRQTNCATQEESERLFHGFVVHVKPDAARITKEGLVPATPPPSAAKPAKTKIVYHDTTITVTNVQITRKVKKNCEPTGQFLPRSKKKREEGHRYDNGTVMAFWKRKPEQNCTSSVSYKYDTTTRQVTVKVDQKGRFQDKSIGQNHSDFAVKESMDRNWGVWKQAETIVVQDVTASMSSYIPQILLWNEQYAADGVRHFVFFNDGDGKPENKKVIGKIGGLYYINSGKFNEIEQLAQQAISKGFSGTAAENNVEALIFAQKKCDKCKSMVMVADQYAPVKDMAFLKEVKLPVHVIICGAGSNATISLDYLTIAAHTGGSIHTASLDIDLSDAQKGQPFTVNDIEYRYRKGKVTPVVK